MSARIAAGSKVVRWLRVGLAATLLLVPEVGGIGAGYFRYGDAGLGHRLRGRRVAEFSRVRLHPGRWILVTAGAIRAWEHSLRSRTTW